MEDFTLQDLVSVTHDTEIISKYIKTNGWKELYHAVQNNKLESIKILLSHKVDTHYNRDYCLRYVSQHGKLEIAQLLLENETYKENINDCLILASQNGYLEIIKLLIEKGADVNCQSYSALAGACSGGYLEIVKLLIEKGATGHIDGNSCLFNAVNSSNIEVVKFLLENGCDKYLSNDIILRQASNHGKLEIIELLIEKGAQITLDMIPNSRGEIKKLLSNYQNTPYYGICSDTKLEIKLPELLEIVKNDKYYYVYSSIKTKESGFTIADMKTKNNVLSNFGEPQYFNEI